MPVVNVLPLCSVLLIAGARDVDACRHVRSLANDSKRFIWHRFDEAAVVAAVAASSFQQTGDAVRKVVDANPELQADSVQALALAARVAAVESRGLISSPALFYDGHEPLVDFFQVRRVGQVCGGYACYHRLGAHARLCPLRCCGWTVCSTTSTNPRRWQSSATLQSDSQHR